MLATTSLLTQVDGSAQLVVGPTKVVASVTGPIEGKARQELPTAAALEIVVRPATSVLLTREKLLEDKLRLLLQLVIITPRYPRQLIQIVVQFLTTDADRATTQRHARDFCANELSAAINCCYFALVDANVALYSSFALVALAIVDGAIEVNPDIDVLHHSASHHVICYDVKALHANALLLVELHGLFLERQLFEALDRAATECEAIHLQVQRPTIVDKVARDYVWAPTS